MKKRQSSSSSLEDSPHGPHINAQLVVSKKEPRTRSRYKIDYNPNPKDRPNSSYQQEPRVKNQNKIDKRYLVETKQDLQQRPLKKHEQETNGLLQQPNIKSQTTVKIAKYDQQMGPENAKLLTEAEKIAVDLISQMNLAYKQDIKAFLGKKLAYHKVKLLSTISQTLQNVLTRRKFLQLYGLEEFYKWLLPIEDSKGRWVQPSLAVKMGVLRIVGDLRLSKEELKSYAVNIHKVVYKNMSGSKIPQLKETCASLMKIWDYTIYKQTAGGVKRK